MNKNPSQETKDKISKTMQGNQNAAGKHKERVKKVYRKKGAVDHEKINKMFMKKVKDGEWNKAMANSVAKMMFIRAGHKEREAIARQIKEIRKVREHYKK